MEQFAEPNKALRHSCQCTVQESKSCGYLIHMEVGQPLADIKCHPAAPAATTHVFQSGKGQPWAVCTALMVHAWPLHWQADWPAPDRTGSHQTSELPWLQSAPSSDWSSRTCHTSPEPLWHQRPGAATDSRPPGTPAIRRQRGGVPKQVAGEGCTRSLTSGTFLSKSGATFPREPAGTFAMI